MNPSAFFAALAVCAIARAHLAGDEASKLRNTGNLVATDVAMRRYWREEAAAATLLGQPWPEAEHLGDRLIPVEGGCYAF